MSDYTPTTEQVRQWTAFAQLKGELALLNPFKRQEAFDRWLEAHDAEIRADAWDEARAAIRTLPRWWNEDEQYGEFDLQPLGPDATSEQGAFMAVMEILDANPYRTPRPHYELFPGTQEALDALTIRKEGS